MIRNPSHKCNHDFLLQITSIEELIEFIRIIREGDIDEDRIRKLTQTLKKSTINLKNAVEENK